jgi:hypothetical protein
VEFEPAPAMTLQRPLAVSTRESNHLGVFLMGEGGRLPCGAYGNNSLHAPCDLRFMRPAKARWSKAPSRKGVTRAVCTCK